jgi:hypothetical protein
MRWRWVVILAAVVLTSEYGEVEVVVAEVLASVREARVCLTLAALAPLFGGGNAKRETGKGRGWRLRSCCKHALHTVCYSDVV